LFAVNPRHDVILDRLAYPNIASIPQRIDLAVIATPAPTIPGLVRECVEADVAAAIVISAGFRETGAAGAALEQQVLAEARRGSLRLIGPNCLGVINSHVGLNAAFAATPAQRGHVAFISQSGALCSAVLDWSLRENVGFSAFASVGSMLDVGWGDLLDYLREDPQTHSILLYMESVGDAGTFLAAARAAARIKPVIVLKAGRTAEASRAAASHTGALTGRDDVFDAALRRAGVLRVDTVAELFGLAELLSSQPAAAGPRLAIVTNAGGPGALAADALILGGCRLAALSPTTMSALNGLLPAQWSHGNPIDILGDASPTRFAQTLGLTLRDSETDGVLAILTPQAMSDPSGTAEKLTAVARQNAKPLLACWMGGDAVANGRRILHEAGIPTFVYPETAIRAFNGLWRFGDLQRTLAESRAPGWVTETAPATKIRKACRLIEAAHHAGRSVLSEYESKQILEAYGVATVETRLALTADSAVAAATQLGFPVAIKLHSHSITHKSDVGGVQLDVRDAAGVRKAWQVMDQTVRAKAGPGHFLGVTVQPMVVSDGFELILGSSLDPQFGPVLLFGAGGCLVEVFKDYALELPPLDRGLARRLIARTRISAAFPGARGRPPVDLPRLERLLVNFSELVLRQPAIKEIEMNPLITLNGRPLALDARIILQAGPAAAPPSRPLPMKTKTTSADPQGLPEPTRLSIRKTLASHQTDPAHNFHGPASSHDARTDVAAGAAQQRLRARGPKS